MRRFPPCWCSPAPSTAPDRVARDLVRAGIPAKAIHGNKSQNARQLALREFKEHSLRVLVATDIAARGIDIDELPYVVNFDLPEVPETYVHRIGRTGRAGHYGTALSFCDIAEEPLLRDIEKLLGHPVEEIREHPYPRQVPTAPSKEPCPSSAPGRKAAAGQASVTAASGAVHLCAPETPPAKNVGHGHRKGDTSMKPFVGAIFDLDGTLLDSMDVWNEIDRIFLSRRGISVPEDYLQVVAPHGVSPGGGIYRGAFWAAGIRRRPD